MFFLEQIMEDAGVPVNYLSGSYSSRQKGWPFLICGGDEFFEVYIKSSFAGLIESWEEHGCETTESLSKDMGKKVFILSEPSQASGRTLEILIWRVVTRYLGKLEASRIW